MNNLYNNKLVVYSKSLRANSTFGERILWSKLRNKQLLNIKFKRQVSFLNYILDFYCPSKKICIEVDGSSHDELRYDKDQRRDKELRNVGVKVLRFSESEVRYKIDEVLQTIVNAIEGIV